MEYQSNKQHHKGWCTSLGQLLAGVAAGKINAQSPNAHYSGFEFGDQLNTIKGDGSFLKIDTIDESSGGKNSNRHSSRTKCRIVLKIDKDGKATEDAWLWHHDNRLYKLGKSFFTSDQTKMWHTYYANNVYNK